MAYTSMKGFEWNELHPNAQVNEDGDVLVDPEGELVMVVHPDAPEDHTFDRDLKSVLNELNFLYSKVSE